MKDNKGAMIGVTRADLVRLYHKDKLSQWAIARKFGVTQGAILYWMKKYGIETRKQTDALILAGKSRRFKYENNPRWRGGRFVDRNNGYVMVRAPSHPLADGRGYVKEHRLVWYEANGPIPKGHHIHHKNGDKTDNRLENLEAMTDQKHRQVIPDLLKRIAELEKKIRRIEK